MGGVGLSRLVAVGDDDDVAPLKDPQGHRGNRVPFASSPGIARREVTAPGERVDVLLALDDVDGTVGTIGREFVEAVGHARRIVEPPDPAAGPVGPPLPELLSDESDDLKEQRPALVGVVVDRVDLPRATRALGMRHSALTWAVHFV